jgi:hypothetical protein
VEARLISDERRFSQATASRSRRRQRDEVACFRRSVFGEQLGQRAEGPAVHWLVATAVKARAGKGNIAEHGAKDDRVFSFVAEVTTAGRTAAMSIDKGRRLSCDDRR